MIAPDWIALDWGTSRLRAFAMGEGDTVLARAESEAGMARLNSPAEFEAALLALVEPWLRPNHVTAAIACGMVGARQGWIEAPYAPVPCEPQSAGAIAAPITDHRLAVSILPGLSQRQPAPDVMRGEETQIAGLIAREPRFDGTICLPGTHTKWAHISAGEVVSFTSFMTGELFDLLATRSVLRHGLGDTGWSEPDFTEAVEAALARPERLASRLFGLRAEGLLDGLAPERARSKLSGFLIGAELASARPHWLGRDVVLIGTPAIAEPYRLGLALSGLTARTADATEMTLAGLAVARSAGLGKGARP